jgi:conjugative relaxase-like TrwC/TraI family protein
MVATISPLHGGNATYYTKSYYLDGRAEGEWLETGAASELGVAGEPVRPREFERLLLGFHPQADEKLVQNAGKEDRQLGWDVQFAVHKSFSALAALVPEGRAELEACLREAVRSTVVEVVEPQFLETRRGRGGAVREPVSSPVAVFLHRTNRENEVHLHCHSAIPNVGLRRDGTFGSLVSWNLYEAKLALGKAFHARFAEQAAARLGVECEFDEHGLSRVKGFPERVAEALSTPARRIAEASVDATSKAKEEANLRLRPPKGELPFEVVVEGCRERAAELGFTEDDARAFLGRAPRVEQGPADEAARAHLRAVVAGLPEEFSKSQLFEAAFREGAKAGLPFAAVNEAIRETLASDLEATGRAGRKELFRKAGELGHLAAGASSGKSAEEELRGFLGRIIETTPELRVAEFLPPGEAALDDPGDLRPIVEPEGPTQAAPVYSNRLFARTLEETVASVAADGPLAENPRARAAFKEALRAELEATATGDPRPLEAAFIDTANLGAAASRAAADEGERTRSRWADEAPGLSAKEARSLLGRAVEAARTNYARNLVEAAVGQALDELTQREAHFSRRDLEDGVAAALSGKPAPPSLVEEALAATLSDPKRVVALGDFQGSDHYTTLQMLRAEQEGLAAAKVLQERTGRAESRSSVERRLGRAPELSADQREAVVKAVSGSGLVLLQADNGLEMQAVQRGIREALGSKDALWVAPTATAARELEKSVGAEQVATLQKLLYNLDRGFGEAVKHHGRMMLNAALGRPTWDARQLQFSPGTTVVLDSASLADTWRFSRLLQHAAGADARVIACATHGMPPLGPGGFFQELRRASDPAHVASLAGEAASRINYLPLRNHEEAKDALIKTWFGAASKRPEDHTIVAASGQDVRELNARAQAARKAAGLLGFRSLEVRYRLDGQLVKERVYEGDRVVFTARTAAETVNGVFGTVKHIDLLTGRVKVGLDLKEKRRLPWEFERQKTVEFQYRNYRFFQRQEEGFRLGYAATVYRSQNVAVEGDSYCLVGGPDGAPSAVYAGLGLAKGATYFFGDGSDPRAELLREKQTAHAVARAAERRERTREVEDAARPRSRAEGRELGVDFKMSF